MYRIWICECGGVGIAGSGTIAGQWELPVLVAVLDHSTRATHPLRSYEHIVVPHVCRWLHLLMGLVGASAARAQSWSCLRQLVHSRALTIWSPSPMTRKH